MEFMAKKIDLSEYAQNPEEQMLLGSPSRRLWLISIADIPNSGYRSQGPTHRTDLIAHFVVCMDYK